MIGSITIAAIKSLATIAVIYFVAKHYLPKGVDRILYKKEEKDDFEQLILKSKLSMRGGFDLQTSSFESENQTVQSKKNKKTKIYLPNLREMAISAYNSPLEAMKSKERLRMIALLEGDLGAFKQLTEKINAIEGHDIFVFQEVKTYFEEVLNLGLFQLEINESPVRYEDMLTTLYTYGSFKRLYKEALAQGEGKLTKFYASKTELKSSSISYASFLILGEQLNISFSNLINNLSKDKLGRLIQKIANDKINAGIYKLIHEEFFLTPDSEEKFVDKLASFAICLNHMSDKELKEQSQELYYRSLLGVEEGSSVHEVKKIYRKKVMKFHPDKIAGRGLPEELIELANGQFQEIQEAFQYLKAA